MRAVFRSGPLLLALGVALIGCSRSSGPAANAPPRPAGVEAPTAGRPDVTLVVEGMT
jgi:hypothetical protein